MTPEQITLVESSMEQARSGFGELAADFYRRLFGAEPQLRDLFPNDVAEQQRKFIEQLDALVNAIRERLTSRRRGGAPTTSRQRR